MINGIHEKKEVYSKEVNTSNHATSPAAADIPTLLLYSQLFYKEFNLHFVFHLLLLFY